MSVEKIQVNYTLTRIKGTLHENLCTFMSASRLILVRIRNVSDKIYSENQSVNFMFHNVLPKIVPFLRQCSTAGQATGDKTAQAFYMLA
jgi:TRAP-type mannitol/chloroaromatic compound transport system substrate-binding protein